MALKRVCKWLVISGTLLIWAVKFGIRPACDCQTSLVFFLGIAPNLFGSFLIPFAAFWFFAGRGSLLAQIFRIHSIGDLRIVCMMGFGLLVFNEYLQLVPVFGRTFDYFDLVFSGVGLLFAYLIFGRMHNRFMYRYYPD